MKDSMSVFRFATYIFLYIAFAFSMFFLVVGTLGLAGISNFFSFMVAGSYAMISYCWLTIWLLNKLDGFK